MTKTRKMGALFLALAMAFSTFTSLIPTTVKAAEAISLTAVEDVTVDGNVEQ